VRINSKTFTLALVLLVRKDKSHWISLKTLIKNHPNSTITVASTPTSITTTKRKVIYKQRRLACLATYKKVVKDIEHIQRYSLNTSFYNRQYSDILRNQIIRAHCHSLLETALKFEQFMQKYPHNKDPTWFLKKAAEDLFVFTDQLQ